MLGSRNILFAAVISRKYIKYNSKSKYSRTLHVKTSITECAWYPSNLGVFFTSFWVLYAYNSYEVINCICGWCYILHNPASSSSRTPRRSNGIRLKRQESDGAQWYKWWPLTFCVLVCMLKKAISSCLNWKWWSDGWNTRLQCMWWDGVYYIFGDIKCTVVL